MASTEEHFHRVKELSIRLAHHIGLSNSEVEKLGLLAMLHDIGKAAIPDDVLEKPGSLNSEEWSLMKQHCEIGYRIAVATPEIAPIANFILYHHEHWDGSVYPFGLKKDEIPKLSRIFSIIDAYDVMIYSRPYR
ncbi:HD domain-containing protein [Clostridium sp. PL3]|uniref:HD domain-containing protein n=1 Tax=Clostridium thailandense TaxID=2794346 RepID=A0A949TLL2_9CLOT|nr:HD domain-containing phosphohydrolase [Clostridium thailandense]MBV7271542.1 HD domain-containing protein [Clostridium thailandense]